MLSRRRFILAAVAAFSASLALTAPVMAQKATITILHSNDVYEISPKQGIGGLAELATLVKQERARSPNTVFTLGGDTVGSSMMSGITKGVQMIELWNALGLEVAVVGNHEFDFGPDVFKQRVAESKFPWLGTNMLGADGKPFGGAKDYLIRKMGDVTVGFFGVITPGTTHLSSPGADVKFTDVTETARAAVKHLRDQGADVVVAMTHLDLADDRALAREVKGIDVILGGHDHDPMSIYEGGVFIFKVGYDAHYLGVADISVEKRQVQNRTQVTVRPQGWRYVTTAGVAPDPQVAAVVKKYEDQLAKELQIEVGKTAVELDSRRATVRLKEAAIGNLIADAMREATRADVALTNGGGIRGDRTYAAGTVLTRKDVLTELPFGNITVVIELTGADLKLAIEQGVSDVENTAGRFPQVSGMKFSFDPRAPKLARVTDVTVGGKPLDPAARYRVATNDYMFGGGDGYAALTRGKAIVDASAGALMANQVMDYITAKGSVSPQVEGRIAERR